MTTRTLKIITVLIAVALGLAWAVQPVSQAQSTEPADPPKEEEPADTDEPKTPEEMEQMFGENAELAAKLYAQGYSYGLIAQAMALAEDRDLTAEQILLLGDSHGHWGQVKQALNMADTSELSAEEILALGKEHAWGDVKKAVKLDPLTDLSAKELLELKKQKKGWGKIEESLSTTEEDTAAETQDATPGKPKPWWVRLKMKLGFGTRGTAGVEKKMEKAEAKNQRAAEKAAQALERAQKKAATAEDRVQTKAEKQTRKGEKAAGRKGGPKKP